MQQGMYKLASIEPKCNRKGNHRADQHVQACLDRAKVQLEATSPSGSACSSLPRSSQSVIGREITERISMLKLAWIEQKCNRKGNHRADQHAQACLDRAKVQSEGKSRSGSACSSLPGSSQSAIGSEITQRISMLKLPLVEPKCNWKRNHKADQHVRAGRGRVRPRVPRVPRVPRMPRVPRTCIRILV